MGFNVADIAPNAGQVVLWQQHPLFANGPWRELAQMYKETHTADGIEVVRGFDIPWSNKDVWIANCLGWVTCKPADAIQITRHAPWQHPTIPWLYAQKADVLNGLGVPGIDGGPLAAKTPLVHFYDPKNLSLPSPKIPGSPNADATKAIAPDGYARIAVTFRSLLYEALDNNDPQFAGKNPGDAIELGRYVTRGKGYAVENLRIDGASYQFAGGTPVMDYSYQIYPTIQLVYTWHDVPCSPQVGALACIGTVNLNTFDTQGGNWPVGTLLCFAPDEKRKPRGHDGGKRFDAAFKFGYRPNGWNKFFNKTSGKFEPVTNKQGNPPFASSNFSQLFTIDPLDLNNT